MSVTRFNKVSITRHWQTPAYEVFIAVLRMENGVEYLIGAPTSAELEYVVKNFAEFDIDLNKVQHVVMPKFLLSDKTVTPITQPELQEPEPPDAA